MSTEGKDRSHTEEETDKALGWLREEYISVVEVLRSMNADTHWDDSYDGSEAKHEPQMILYIASISVTQKT